jgi:hypothetical protein
VENRSNDHLPTLIQSIDDLIARGQQGPHPKYQATPVELAPSQGNMVFDTAKPAAQQTFFIEDQTTMLANPGLKKKARKIPEKDYASNQPTRVLEKIPMQERSYDAVGEPKVSRENYLILPGDMRSLYDNILIQQMCLLKMASATYPLFVAKVPEGMDFIDEHPADVFFLSFEDKFSIFHMNRLHRNLVRLFALNKAYQVKKARVIPE